jgi:hypothetical protein
MVSVKLLCGLSVSLRGKVRIKNTSKNYKPKSPAIGRRIEVESELTRELPLIYLQSILKQ